MKLKSIIFFYLFIIPLQASPFLNTQFNHNKVINRYLKQHRSFFKQSCRAGKEESYWRLYRNYRGDGNYIPSLDNENIDYQTIREHLPLLTKKEKWILKTIEHLSKERNIRSKLKKIKNLELKIKKLLNYKYEFDKKRKLVTLNRSKELLQSLSADYQLLIKDLRFLTPFSHPQDYLVLRAEYDRLKENKNEKKKANSVYFYRRIVEDGALNNDKTSSDFYLRGLISSIHFRLMEKRSFISENLRYDLTSLFSYLNKSIKKGKKYHLQKLNGWYERARTTRVFYQELLRNKKMKQKFYQKKMAIEKLKNFNYSSQTKVYDYWSSQDLLMQAIFSMETILFNEVGNYDGLGRLESHDVARVVLNRYYKKKYNTLPADDPFILYAKAENKNFDDSKLWLNLLFKTGEFSFTYYYIPGSVKVYCPDMTRRGKKLRRRNIEIALAILTRGVEGFDGLRYFSRASMTGRIDMATLWNNYRVIPEAPGLKMGRSKKLKKALRARKLQYYYSFFDIKKQKYDVYGLGEQTYVMHLNTQQFYHYRNPHLFRFFSHKL